MKKVKLGIFLILIMIFISMNFLYGQDKRERIGDDEIIKNGINYYNYSDKDKINFEVSVWGYVKSPGKYLIPKGTTFIDLITLCGGPLNEAKLNDIRIVRLKNDSSNINEDKVIVLNYSDFLLEEKIQNINKTNPLLLPGDIVLIPGGQKSAFRENFTFILTAITTLTSVAVLLVTVLKNN